MNELYLYHKRNRIKQYEVAKHINVAQSAYSAKVRGVTEFTLTEAIQVAKFIGIESVDELCKMLTNWVIQKC